MPTKHLSLPFDKLISLDFVKVCEVKVNCRLETYRKQQSQDTHTLIPGNGGVKDWVRGSDTHTYLGITRHRHSHTWELGSQEPSRWRWRPGAAAAEARSNGGRTSSRNRIVYSRPSPNNRPVSNQVTQICKWETSKLSYYRCYFWESVILGKLRFNLNLNILLLSQRNLYVSNISK